MKDIRRLRDDEWFDEVRIGVVPRYKTSELSGNEWRISAVIQFLRKGIVMVEKRCSDMATAILWLPWGWAFAGEDPDIDVRPERFPHGYCSQPGCASQATNVYGVKTLYERSGEKSAHQSNDYIRLFCDRHAGRGDADKEDCDLNYEVLVGSGPLGARQEPSDVSVSVFLGNINLTDEGEEGRVP